MTKDATATLALLLIACNDGGKDDTAGPDTGPTDVVRPDCDDPAPFPEIKGDTTIPEGCYLVESNVNITDQTLLTLDPGVVLIFEQNLRLEINGGKLNAEGTASKPIWLTGAQEVDGFWGGLLFHNTDYVENVLTNVHIEYGGSDDTSGAGLYLDDDSGPVRLSMSDSIVMGSAAYGVYMEQNSNRHNLDVFSHNTFSENAISGLMEATQLDDLDGTNVWSGNAEDYLAIEGPVPGGGTWPALDVPYRAQANVQIVDGGSVTIAAGAQLEFEQNVGFEVSQGGSLSVQGTDKAPVVFTGVQETRGFWSGLLFDSTDSLDNNLSHAVIEYAGAGGDDSSAALYLDDDTGTTRLTMDDTTIRESAGWAIYAEFNSNHPSLDSFENNTLTANAKTMRWGAEDVGELSDTSTFSGNDADYVLIEDNVISTQTWPTLDVPYRVPGTVGVNKGGGVTMTPGTTVELAQDAEFAVYKGGYLNAEGTKAEPITFTGTQQTAGHWGRLLFDSTNHVENSLANVVLEYGGGDKGDDDGLLYLDDDTGQTMISITDCLFQHSTTYGIYAETNSNPPALTCSDNTYKDVAAGSYNKEISCP